MKLVGRRYDDQGGGDDEGVDAFSRNPLALHQRRRGIMVTIIFPLSLQAEERRERHDGG